LPPVCSTAKIRSDMIRKYLSLMKSWELERPKPVLPFPDGIVAAQAPQGCKGEWMGVMAAHDRWPVSADETGWAIELAGVARATEELSLCVDTVLARTEMGEPLQGWEVETLVDCFNGLLSCWDRREACISESVLPWLESLTDGKVTTAEQKALEHLRKSYKQRRKRVGMTSAAFSKLGEAAGSAELPGQVYAMRIVKDSFDVFQAINIAAAQLEVESAMWLVRKVTSQAEFERRWRAASRGRGGVLKAGALAVRGAPHRERVLWLLAEGTSEWLCSVYAFGTLFVQLSGWRKPLEAVLAGEKPEPVLPRCVPSRAMSA